jgi:hypothetical protein
LTQEISLEICLGLASALTMRRHVGRVSISNATADYATSNKRPLGVGVLIIKIIIIIIIIITTTTTTKK